MPSIRDAVVETTRNLAVHGISEIGRAGREVITEKVDLVRNGRKKDEDVIDVEIIEEGENSARMNDAIAAFGRLSKEDMDKFIDWIVDLNRDKISHDYNTPDNDSPLPMTFDLGSKKKNLEAAAAARRLWGCTDYCDDFTIIAMNPHDGSCFVGNMESLAQYCSQNDLDDDWNVTGIDSDGNYDDSDFDDLKISNEAVKYVAALAGKRSSESERDFRGFHWDKKAQVTTVVKEIPGLEGKNLAMLGSAKSIIYYAEKGGKTDVYIHEFGEDSGRNPTLYSMGDRVLIIHGGNMKIEDRGIVD